MFDYGIDGEVEFKNNDGKASGKKIYVQIKSGNSYLRTRKADASRASRWVPNAPSWARRDPASCSRASARRG
ncbi:MAG: DUF4365 domain-containing protein [Gammaproteobacteria bacterium]